MNDERLTQLERQAQYFQDAKERGRIGTADEILELIAALRSERQARQAAEQKLDWVRNENLRIAEIVSGKEQLTIVDLVDSVRSFKARADALLAAGTRLAEAINQRRVADRTVDAHVADCDACEDYHCFGSVKLCERANRAYYAESTALAAWEQAQPEKEKG